jgi:hypothetical protein
MSILEWPLPLGKTKTHLKVWVKGRIKTLRQKTL